jgi:hypothetical protein
VKHSTEPIVGAIAHGHEVHTDTPDMGSPIKKSSPANKGVLPDVLVRIQVPGAAYPNVVAYVQRCVQSRQANMNAGFIAG